jgi:hypothetical protein
MDELAVLEFCCTAGIPRSVFLGRVVGVGEPLWSEDDRRAALEWQAYKKALCPGCNRPRSESFAVEMFDHYDVTPLVCHACAARDQRAHNEYRENNGRPLHGRFYAVVPESVNGHDV